ncbi:MAG: SAVED domain-containing protein [Bacteroidales bacterium]|nr:SAVED domain-containing protein [Bacteroidales bacterium]
MQRNEIKRQNPTAKRKGCSFNHVLFFILKHVQLEQFNSVAHMAMDAIKTEHPEADQLKIFRAAPASCAVELGRIRMPKADLPWVLYDYWEEKGEDVETITIK